MRPLEVNIQNDIDLHAANIRALALREVARPKNTIRTYTKRQTEWETFY
jgi:hypothetical protein